jgi:predicted outer membrane protein
MRPLLLFLLFALGCRGTAVTRSGAMSDDEIATFAATVLSSQLDLARLAGERALSPDVREGATAFEREAATLMSELSAWQHDPSRAEAHSETTRLVAERSRRTASVLRTFEGSDFDREYLAARDASAHYLLDSLDRVLLPSARDATLRSILQRLRRLTEPGP